jgi:chromosome segregation ATPase
VERMNEELLRRILQEELKGIKEDVTIMKQDISGLKEDVSGLKVDVSGLKEDVSGLKIDVSGLKEDVSGLKEDVSGLKEDVTNMKQDISDLKAKTDRIEECQKMIFNEVGGLMEFRTEAIQKIDKLTENIEFLSHKGNETEKEVFFLKRKLL